MKSNKVLRIFLNLKFIFLLFGICLIGSNLNLVLCNYIDKNSENYYNLNLINTAEIGEKLNVSLHQSYYSSSPIGFMNLSESNNFNLPCPIDITFNTSYTEFQVEDIYAPNKSILVEDRHEWTVYESTSSNYCYMSFSPKGGVGYLENISFMVKETDEIIKTTLDIYLYNAENVSGRQRPYEQIVINSIVDDTEIIGEHFHWHNITNIHAKYNCSETFDNFFFLLIDKSSGPASNVQFNGTLDNEFGDSSDDVMILDETEHAVRWAGTGPRIDFALKYEYSPLNNTPSPSEINLKINNTPVEDDIANSGNWISNEELSSPSGQLEFDITSDWWDVTCDISEIQINFTKSDLQATTNYEIPEPNLIIWNASIDKPIDSFDSRIDDYNYITYWIPENWSDVEAFSGSIEKPIKISITTKNGYKEAKIFQAENGGNWYLLFVIDNRTPSTPSIPFGNYYLLFTTVVVIFLIYFKRSKYKMKS